VIPLLSYTLERDIMGRLGGTLPKEESTHLKENHGGATTKLHLLPDAAHFTTKAKCSAYLLGRLGTSPKDQEMVN